MVVGSALGAYGASVTSGYQVFDVLRWSLREAGDVFLLVVGVPLIGAFSLFAAQLRARSRDAEISAELLSVTFAYVLLVVVQVGAFASVNVHQLAERDLTTVAPPILVAFTVWVVPRAAPTAASDLGIRVARDPRLPSCFRSGCW